MNRKKCSKDGEAVADDCMDAGGRAMQEQLPTHVAIAVRQTQKFNAGTIVFKLMPKFIKVKSNE